MKGEFIVRKISFKLALALMLVVSLVGTGVVNAEKPADNVSRNHFGETITDSINVKGVEIDLYLEFVDREKALQDIKKEYRETLEFLKGEFNLGELSEENWQEYSQATTAMEGYADKVSEKIMKESIKIGQFFDIYENNEQNDVIEELSSQINEEANQTTSITENENSLVAQLNLLIPYTSKRLPDTTLKTDITIESTIGIDLDAAINYATDYATSPNTPTYEYFSTGDCTNFVSQILEAGGIPQEVYDSQYLGWWHTSYVSWEGVILHEHSLSWINANIFANYMGISYTTTDHFTFSYNLDKGSIIGYDKYSDGDWNHMAFVTDKDTYASTYDGKYYYDYKVAQHTTNYHAWTSSSTNGWENLEDNGYTYGIIRE